jgi:hypothetical protein
MSTIEQRRAHADECLKTCKGYLVCPKDDWDGLTPFMKDNTIGSTCTLIHFSCDFIRVDKKWVEELFRENGGWEADHPFTTGVLQRLKEWNSLAE